MEKQRLSYLLQQHLYSAATADEQQELSALLQADTDRELFNSVLAEMMQQETPVVPANAVLWQQMVQDIVAIDKVSVTPARAIRSNRFRIYRWVAAAAVLVLISTAIYFFSSRPQQQDITGTEKIVSPLVYTQVTKNMLTLHDGRQIWLDEVKDGPITRVGSTTITKQGNRIVYTTTGDKEAAGFNIISTTRGSEYGIVLSDGSEVWLNAASTFRFPVVFFSGERTVDLLGQAWFDVQHADVQPFLVHSGSFTTSVMGTAFDIKDYPDEKSKAVSVQRGKVRVQAGDKLLATLEKGQQVRVNSDTVAHQQAVDIATISAWKQGTLVYTDETLEAIVADLQRVFEGRVVIKTSSLKDVVATGVFSKREGLQKALEIICKLTDSHLSHKEGIYIIE